MTSTLLREELVEYSVLQAIQEGLPGYGFAVNGSQPDLILREAFPTPDERTQPLTITTVAFGFNIDDGGREVELGSDLTQYMHTLELWTFATEPKFGRRVAHSMKHIARKREIPLRDYNQEGDPQIDSLWCAKAQVRHQANNSVRPWDQFVWTTSLVIRDYDYP